MVDEDEKVTPMRGETALRTLVRVDNWTFVVGFAALLLTIIVTLAASEETDTINLLENFSTPLLISLIAMLVTEKLSSSRKRQLRDEVLMREFQELYQKVSHDIVDSNETERVI